jgi:hypothetical protein
MMPWGIEITKDDVELVSKVVQSLAGLVTIVVAIWALRKGREELKMARAQRQSETDQRKEDLRWKRAEKAKEYLDFIHVHPKAGSAVTMLDHGLWPAYCSSFEVRKDRLIDVCWNDVLATFQGESSSAEVALQNEKTVFIEDCFDWFFYYVDQLEHYIQINLIDFNDVRHVFRPYVKIVCDERIGFQKFLRRQDYGLATSFWNRKFEG